MLLLDIGKTIKKRRKELKITQPSLARLTGVSVNTISQIEIGRLNSTVLTLNKILEVLGMDFEIVVKKLI